MSVSMDRTAVLDIVRDCWIDTLDLDADEVLLGNTNFFSAGGDSSLARDLCGVLLKDHGIRLTAASVFQHPTLDALVDAILAPSSSSTALPVKKTEAQVGASTIAPFSLLPGDESAAQRSLLVQELATSCGLGVHELEDVYPCTALQEGLVSLSQRDEGSYWASHVYKVDSEEVLARFCAAWDQVIQAYSILRTSIAQTQAGALYQVVSRSHPAFETVDTDLKSFLQDTSLVANTLNAPLSRFAVVKNAQGIWFVWRIHHAAFDAASNRLVLASLEQAWQGQTITPATPFQAFVAETLSYDPEDARRFWAEKLQAANACILPAHGYKPSPLASFATEVRRIDLQWQQRGSKFSLASVIHAAWSLVLARHTGSNDITYGAVLSSREAQWRTVAAPIICTIPARFYIDASESVVDFLSRVQTYMAEAPPYAHMGLQKIRQLGADMEAACSFQSLLVAQPASGSPGGTSASSTLPARSYIKESNFHSYDLTVEAFMRSSEIEVKLHHHEGKILQKEAQRLLRHFEYAISQLIASMTDESSRLSSINLCGPEDLAEIDLFNSARPEPTKSAYCMHQLVSQVAQSNPQSPAAVAYDAPFELSYAQLDAATSLLAQKLIARGVQLGQMIPLLFEKSIWMLVAMLSVLKAGAAFVPLEWTQPFERLQKVVAQVDAIFILTSSSNEALARRFPTQSSPLVVCETALAQLEMDTSLERIELPSVHPSSLAYLVFTSGSTGVPKGVTVSHQAFCTSASHHGPALGFHKTSRVLQFSSYSFDVSIAEMVTTLIAGGCVCIPAEEERLHDLPGVIRRMQVSMAILTPSVFENISVNEDYGALEKVILTGDRSSQQLVDRWSTRINLLNAYGPSESSVWAYIHAFSAFSSSNNIGLPSGCVGWVVDPEDVQKLAPVGCAGELLLEGHILSDGYLHDIEKTRSSFVSNMIWQHDPEKRLYRTGDLVRQNSDGSLCFLGRKDTQIKIRGQRLESAEIENHIRQLLPGDATVAVDVVFRDGQSPDSAILAGFCCFRSGLSTLPSEILSKEDHVKTFLRIRTALSSTLPAYMVPQAYVPIVAMPTSVSGKVDRKRLRSALTNTTDGQWRSYLLANDYAESELSPTQAALRKQWAHCLNTHEDSIHLQDSFFRLGGSSILAMRLSSSCLQSSIKVSVSDVFKNPTLEAMAAVAEFHGDDTQINQYHTNGLSIEPFSLLPRQGLGENEQIPHHLSDLAQLDQEDIEDAYPATQLQEAFIAATQMEPEAYILQRVYCIPESMRPRFREAWTRVVGETAILRTRLVQTQRWGLVQVVTRSFDVLETFTSLDSFVTQARARSVALGEPLNRYALVTDPDRGDFFVWQAHHAAFDGWSLKLITERFLKVYRGEPDIEPSGPFKAFVRNLQDIDVVAGANFWRRRLEGAKLLDFPRSASRSSGRSENHSKALRFPLDRQWRKDCDFTLSTLLHAAWSLVLATHSDTDDVVFGTTLSGRGAPIPGIKEIPGPTITTIPVRYVVDGARSLQEYLVGIQDFLIGVMPFEQFGLLNIRALGTDAEAACSFRTLLLLQPPEESSLGSLDDLGLRVESSAVNMRYHTYDVVLEVFEQGEDLELRMNYNIRCMESTEASWLLSHVKTAMGALTAAVTSDTLARTTVSEITLFGSDDQDQLRQWNAQSPLLAERCIHDLVSEAAMSFPSKEAIRAWDGTLTFGELDTLSSSLAHHLTHEILVRPGEPVLLCFEKSKLAVIAMLAVLKAGAIMVPVEWSHPHARLEEICQGVKARRALTTEKHEATCQSLGLMVSVLSPRLMAQLGEASEGFGSNQRYRVTPDQIAYIIFTSGSTGKPKGIPVRHQAFSTMASYFGDAYCLSSESRVFHFSSYAFDVSLMETLIPLSYNAVVCIPPEQGRKDDLAGSFSHLEANYALLGPGVVANLDVRAMVGLQVLVLGGEAVPEKMLQEWSQVADVVVAYGSTECAAVDHAVAIPRGTKPPSWSGGLVGRSIGSVRSWVVSSTDHNRLAPLGCTGELVVEGPVVCDGYLNDEAQTLSQIIPAHDVAWLRELAGPDMTRLQGNVYKTGDIVRYNVDGTLSYSRRKDLRIKIRGQRVEIGDIEAATRRILTQLASCAAEVIRIRRPQSDSEAQVLAIFVSFPITHQTSPVEGKDFLDNNDHERDMLLLQNELSHSLPSHMVPELYIPVRHIPTAASGKVDRRKLQIALLSSSQDMLDRYRLLKEQTLEEELPVTESEGILRELWADCLNITDKSAISRQSHFLRLGGSSITAMRLSALSREHGLILTVVDIMKNPTLSAMAGAAVQSVRGTETAEEDIAPFSLIDASIGEREGLISRLATKYRLNPADIVDIYACTPLQEGLVALTHAKPREYIAHHVFQISDAIRIESVRSALQGIVAANPICRTSIMEDVELLQIVTSACPPIPELNLPIDMALARMRQQEQQSILGQPLSEFYIVQGEHQGRINVIWKAHHAAYDGWTVSALAAQFRTALEGNPLPRTTPFCQFIAHLKRLDHQAGAYFWKAKLEGSSLCQFPSFENESMSNEPVTCSIAESVAMTVPNGLSNTLSTILHAAWGVTLATYTTADDVAFGTVVSGRQADVAGIDRVMGATVATIPLRIRLDLFGPVTNLLEQVHNYMADATPFEQMGLHHIRRLSRDAEKACSFDTLLVVQPLDIAVKEDEMATVHIYRPQAGNTGSKMPGTYKLTLECVETRGGLDLRLHFNGSAISTERAQWVLRHFTRAINQILTVSEQGLATTVRELDLVGPADLASMNVTQDHVEGSEILECVHTQILNLAEAEPQRNAVDAWDGRLSYRDLAIHSRLLSNQLLRHGLRLEEPVILCIDKSKLFPISALGVLAAGGTIVPVDVTHPIERLQVIAQEVGATKCICTERTSGVTKSLGLRIFNISATGGVNGNSGSKEGFENSGLPEVKPQSLAYIVFTSGSTGVPKGVLISHASLSTSSRHHGEAYEISSRSRVLHFASYAFDVSLAETLTTLLAGGCVCIPSTADCRDNLGAAMEQYRVSVALLTPSVVSALRPQEAAHLTTLVLGGERHTTALRQTWERHCHVVNGYGPAECAISVSSTPPTFAADAGASLLAPNDIGVPHRSATVWIADPRDPNRLVPYGCVGELLVGGPQVARGYLEQGANKPVDSFLANLSWMRHLSKADQRVYRTGDLARWSPEGHLLLVGRRDDQVKIRGQRLELGDVEAELQKTVTALHTTPVVVQEAGALQGSLVVLLTDALSTSQSNLEPLGINKDLLSEGVRTQLQRFESCAPPAMVPSLWIPVRSFPLSSSGKVDRKSLCRAVERLSDEQVASIRSIRFLSEETDDDTTLQDFSPGFTSSLEIIQSKIAEVLQIPQSSLDLDSGASFTMLGGDSIRAMILSSRLHEVGISLKALEILQAKNLVSLFGRAAKAPMHARRPPLQLPLTPPAEEKYPALAPSPDTLSSLVPGYKVETILPCSAVQSYMCKAAQRNPAHYRAVGIMRISPRDKESISEISLARAWPEVVRHHPLLRSVIVATNEGFHLAVLANFTGSLQRVGQHIASEDDAVSLLRGQVRKPLSSNHPPYRIVYCMLANSNDMIVMFDMHHALVDGASMTIVLKDWADAYMCRNITSRDTFLQSLAPYNPASYPLAVIPSPEATLFPRNAVVPDSHPIVLEDSLIHRLQKSAHLAAFTLSTIIQAAWALTLHEMTGVLSPTFGVLLTRRRDNTSLGIVGPLFDIYTQRCDITTADDSMQRIHDLLSLIQEQTLRIMTDEDSAAAASVTQSPNTTTQWNTLVNMRSSSRQPKSGGEGEPELPWSVEHLWAMDPMDHDVILSGLSIDGALRLCLNYYGGVTAKDDIVRAADTTRRHLSTIASMGE